MNVALPRLAAALVACLCAAGQARPEDLDNRVDACVEAQLQAQRIPGLALLVVQGGRVVKSQGYGQANLEHQVPVNEETIFQSGSVGKQFTAAGVLLLVEDGRLALDDPVSKFLPNTPQSWAPITVRQLLSHTAGLGDYPPTFDLRRDYREDALLRAIYAVPLEFEPGTSWSYSNLGYVTLGILIHEITGRPYGEFLAERVFGPSGMTATRIISEADLVPHRAAGYRLVDGAWKNQEWVSPTMNSTADGSLYFNIRDLARWEAALAGDRLLSETSKQAMWTPALLSNGRPNPADYGFGWKLARVRGHRVIEHGGAWQGFTTYIGRYVDDGLTVAVLCNLWAADANPVRIARQVAGLYVPDVAPATNPIDDGARELTARLRAAVERVGQGQADEQDFTPEARAVLFPARIQALAKLFKRLGPIAAFELVEHDDQGAGPSLRRYRVTLDQGRVWYCTLRLDGQGKIAGLDVDRD